MSRAVSSRKPRASSQLRIAAILDAAAKMVRPGGRVVYATCSLLREENDAIVDAFLASHAGFRLVPVYRELQRSGWQGQEACLQLRPDVHGTDGFYAAILERA